MASLRPGTRVGPYEVLAAIGAGGMGQVFRAYDTALHREVALKILPPELADDADYRARFSREARVLATLNHSHIAQVYGLEDSEAGPVIAMELVSGTTLRDRLRRGVAREEALQLAYQIATALDTAHEKGIVHRDLKPGNIMVTPDGAAKVLDFGLAKTADGDQATTDHDTTFAATVQGTVVGTPAYMSPEQTRGHAVDRRTDIWAFGCVLYELLAGGPAFKGASSSDLVVAILERDPDWRALPADTPLALRHLLKRCLERDRRSRLRDIGDALPDLSAPWNAPESDAGVPHRAAGRAVTVALITAALAAGSLGTWLLMRGHGPGGPAVESFPVRFAVPPPAGARFRGTQPELEATTVAVSPDGSTIAFIAGRPGGPPRIWVRPVGEETAREVPGTEAAISMFWSPDGRSLAFFVSGQLKRLDLAGGAAVKICDVPINIGLSGSWGTDGDILFSTVQGDRISRVPAAGGAPVDVVIGSQAGGGRLLWPRHLPGSRRFVYSSLTPDFGGRIMLVELDGTSRPILEASSQVQWIDPDWLVFVREGTLVAQRVNLDLGQPVGEPVSILGTVTYSAATGWANFAASPNGTLVVQWVLSESRIAWFAANGGEIGPVGAPGAYATLRLSPDDSTLLFTRVRPELGTRDIWSTDLARPSEKRVTSSPGMEVGETWLPGGRALVYAASQGGPPNLHYKDLTTGKERRLLTASRFQYPSDVSADGSQVVYEQRTELGNFDLMSVSIADPSRVSPLLVSDASESDARLVPGGTRMAFTSDESGRDQVYLTSFPKVGERKPVSNSGGSAPRWRRDGRELYFISGSRQLMAASIGATGVSSAPRVLFDVKDWLDFDVARDGRFIAVVSQKITGEQPLAVILNWPQLLGRTR